MKKKSTASVETDATIFFAQIRHDAVCHREFRARHFFKSVTMATQADSQLHDQIITRHPYSRQCGQFRLLGKSAVLGWPLPVRYQQTHRPGLISYVCSAQHLEGLIPVYQHKNPYLPGSCPVSFYRAMHFSAKRGIAIACRLSVCLSVCNVGEL